MKTDVKKEIEKKQTRLNRFVNQGRLSQQTANEQVLQLAKILVYKRG